MPQQIAYKGFACKHSVFLGLSFGGAQSAVRDANKWIKANNIKVLNVETMINVHGFTHTTVTEQDNIRVWYLIEDNEGSNVAK